MKQKFTEQKILRRWTICKGQLKVCSVRLNLERFTMCHVSILIICCLYITLLFIVYIIIFPCLYYVMFTQSILSTPLVSVIWQIPHTNTSNLQPWNLHSSPPVKVTFLNVSPLCPLYVEISSQHQGCLYFHFNTAVNKCQSEKKTISFRQPGRRKYRERNQSCHLVGGTQ